jgi:hypothetical protein
MLLLRSSRFMANNQLEARSARARTSVEIVVYEIQSDIQVLCGPKEMLVC